MMPDHTIELSDYEAANLKYALELISFNDQRPMGWLNTGDWLGQILQRLPESPVSPNPVRKS